MKTGKRYFFFLLAAALGCANGGRAAENARNLLPNPELRADADGKPRDWALWSPRPTLAAKGAIASTDGAPALSLHADRFECVGKWRTLVREIEPGKYYRFEVQHRTENVKTSATSVLVILSWFRTADGEDEVQRDYVLPVSTRGEWVASARTFRAPDGAKSVRVELGLRWTAGGSAWWKEARFAEVKAPPERKVRVATTRVVPKIEGATVESNTQMMMTMFDEVGPEHPDIVLFSENLATRFVRRPLAERAQPIPGPLTQQLSAKAKQYHTYAIATLLEADHGLFHNTAVLIDREGRIAGKYRKVHLTIGETDGGLTPGTDYPVFQTDFGRIGIMTCWDGWFGESARALRLNGAEILFLPLAGDSEPAHWGNIWKTRAIDNGIWLVSSVTVTEAPSQILNPQGEVLAETTGEFDHVLAELDLNREWRVRYMSVSKGYGDAATFYIKERRADTYSVLEEGVAPDRNLKTPPVATEQQ
jgi:predicted amidohydrolase